MTVETRSVQGRRQLRFESIDEMLADAESLAAQPVRTLGNWSAGQIFKHLALALESAVNGVEYRPPLVLRLVAGFLKKTYLTKPLRPGFRMPEALKPVFMPPDEISTEDGLSALRTAVAQYLATTELGRHAVFGEISRGEHDMMQLRHAEMHLSFIVPE